MPEYLIGHCPHRTFLYGSVRVCLLCHSNRKDVVITRQYSFIHSFGYNELLPIVLSHSVGLVSGRMVDNGRSVGWLVVTY